MFNYSEYPDHIKRADDVYLILMDMSCAAASRGDFVAERMYVDMRRVLAEVIVDYKDRVRGL